MKASLKEFFYKLNRQGEELVDAFQDLSDVAADSSLKDHPAVQNLIRKVQYRMDRAATIMKYTQSEEEDVENASYDSNALLEMRDKEIAKLKEQIEILRAQLPTDEGMTKAERELAPHNAIEAIKLVRARTGWGLKEAKDVVEKYLANHKSTFTRA